MRFSEGSLPISPLLDDTLKEKSMRAISAFISMTTSPFACVRSTVLFDLPTIGMPEAGSSMSVSYEIGS